MVKRELGAMPKKKPALLGACSLQSQILQICGGKKLLSELCHFHLTENDHKLRYADKVGDRLVSDFGPEITAVRDRILAPAAILRDAVKGRVTAARRLTKILRYHYAAQYLRIGIDNGMPARPTAVLLEHAWTVKHENVLRSAAEKAATDEDIPSILRNWFAHARFDIDHLPERLTVWRGGVCGKGYSPSDLAGGISWTLASGAAADFAALNPYHAGHRSQSGAFNCVVRRRVGRREVLAHFRKRGEDEVILFPTLVGTWTIDGGYNDVTKRRRPSMKQQRAWKESAEAWRADQPDER